MATDFIREIIDDDNRTGKHAGRVLTRFPPEPNGYLHIGHAKSICLNFGIAAQYGTRCNLRFDDTNPVKEDVEYVESIERDVQWLGFSFGDVALYASDYFEEMYQLAEDLVREGKAYVCHLTDEEIKDYRGTLSEPGRPSPYRDRGADENLKLLREMRGGGLADGTCVLRAKIDMAASNMKMRDPLLYRIRHAHHHRTGDAWCIYPMYDYAHPISDAIEGITHSICTLEFENNRELYDWVVEHTRVSERHGFSRPQQIEFARLALDYTVMSKRKLLTLVKDGHVAGWDDPRMPTIAGMRRRGYSPEAIRAFAEMIGVAKANSTVDIGKLEYCVRDDLNHNAPRVLGVLRPMRVTITNWEAGKVEELTAPYFPADVGKPGSRGVPFAGEILIDRDDAAKLAPGKTVRLRYGPAITCDEVVGDALRCRTVEGGSGLPVLHWVSAVEALPAEIRLYDRLFKVARPEDAEGDFVQNLNPGSLEVVRGAMVEPSLARAEVGSRWQLERVGYFVVDQDSRPGALVLNRVITLKDVEVKVEAAAPREKSAKAKTRPPKKSGAEYRAEARNRDAYLAAAYDRLQRDGLGATEADVITGDRATLEFFTAAADAAAPASASVVAGWVVNEVPRVLGERPIDTIDARKLGQLVLETDRGAIARPAAKEMLARLAEGGELDGAAAATIDDDAIAALVDDVIAKNADKVAAYRGGKTGLLGFFVGQVVKASQGKASPPRVQALLTARLSS